MRKVTVLLLVFFALFMLHSFAWAKKADVQNKQITTFADQQTSPAKAAIKVNKISQSPGVTVAGDRSGTYDDWQSNGGDEKRFWLLPDGTAHASFEGDTEDALSGGTGRGTYYSYSDDFGATWTYAGRVQPRRSGYHGTDVTSDGRAVVAAHTVPAGLSIGPAIYIDAIAGFGFFTEYVAPQGVNDWTWPQVSVPTDDHIFYTGYSGVDGDEDMWNTLNPNTLTFGENRNLFPDVDNEIRACTVRSSDGQYVTTLLINGQDATEDPPDWMDNNIIAMTSTDFGQTFGDPYAITNFSADTTQEVIAGLWLGISAVYVGTELHVVWTMVDDLEPGDSGISYNFDSMRIMHWAETVNGGEPTVAVRWDSIHFAGDELGSATLGTNHLRIGYPKIGVDEDGTLGVVFVGFSGDSTTADPQTNIAYGDIWAVASADNGLQWGEPTNLTQSVDMDDRYPYLSVWNEAGKLNIQYMTDAVAGSHTFSDGAPLSQTDQLFLKADMPSTDPYDPVKVESKQISGVPAAYDLGQNYPNPFNPTTAIEFSLQKNAKVRLDVFNTLGERVATLVDGYTNAGTHQVTWTASDMSSGVYFYTLTTNEFSTTRKMMLIK